MLTISKILRHRENVRHSTKKGISLYIMSSLFVKKKYQQKIKKVRNLIGGLMWIPNGIVTNLPAGIISVVSKSEWIFESIHWLGKGATIGPMSPHPWFILLKMKYLIKCLPCTPASYSLSFFVGSYASTGICKEYI